MQHRCGHQRRGISHSDLLVLGCAVIVLFGAATVAVNRIASDERERRVEDQLREIHQAFLISAEAHRGMMLTPGSVRRLPPPGLDRRIPGQGPEDRSQNTTANLYSAMIAQNFFHPPLVVAANDTNPRVHVMENYDWDAFNPDEAAYWDSHFRADLETESHASFAHLLLYGVRSRLHWRDTNNRIPVLSTRGPRDGKNDPASLTTDDDGNWSGSVMPHPDGQERINTMTPGWLPPVVPQPGDDEAIKLAPIPDNIFAIDGGAAGSDVILAFTLKSSDDGPILQFD